MNSVSESPKSNSPKKYPTFINLSENEIDGLKDMKVGDKTTITLQVEVSGIKTNEEFYCCEDCSPGDKKCLKGTFKVLETKQPAKAPKGQRPEVLRSALGKRI